MSARIVTAETGRAVPSRPDPGRRIRDGGDRCALQDRHVPFGPALIVRRARPREFRPSAAA